MSSLAESENRFDSSADESVKPEDSSAASGEGQSSSSSAASAGAEKRNVAVFDRDSKGSLHFDSESAKSAVDFAVRQGMPLFKKYSYFVVGDAPFQNVIRYAHYLKELRSRSARYSLTFETEDDDTATYTFNLNNAMDLFGEAISRYSSPYWHMSYVRAAVDDKTKQAVSNRDDWVWYEPNYTAWNRAWKTGAEYFRKKKIRSYFEVWNEPDIDLWTKFDWDAYLRLYKNSATALREGDPDAFVGGVVAADVLNRLGVSEFARFLDTMKSDNVPVDFVSFHNYHLTYEKELARIKPELVKRKGYETTQIHYSEFNVYSPPFSEWYLDFSKRKDFTLQKCDKIPLMYKAMEDFNNHPDVTSIHWAAFMDGSGAFSVINPDGTRAATYHAHYLYAHMPAERVKSSVSGTQTGIMASADSGAAAALLWNNTKKEISENVVLRNVPFDDYEVTIYRIDADHASILENSKTDELLPLEQYKRCDRKTLRWSGKIPANGTVYLEIRKTGSRSELEAHSSVGRILRCDYYFENRMQNAYADFDELTSSALLGMGDNATGRSLVAVTYESIKDKIRVVGRYDRPQKIDRNTCLGIRVDYASESGYVRSVFYTNDVLSADRSAAYVYGTKRKPDEIVRVKDLTSFVLDIKGKAPSGWTGKVVISFEMQNTGKRTEAKFKLS